MKHDDNHDILFHIEFLQIVLVFKFHDVSPSQAAFYQEVHQIVLYYYSFIPIYTAL